MIDEDKLKSKILEQRKIIKNQTIAITVMAQMLDGLCDSVEEVMSLCNSGSTKDLEIQHILTGGDTAWEDDDDDGDGDDDNNYNIFLPVISDN